MAPLDFTELLKDAPLGQWIALSNDQKRIVASSESFQDAINTAHASGEVDPVMMKLPRTGALVV